MNYKFRTARTLDVTTVDFTVDDSDNAMADALGAAFNKPIDYVFGVGETALYDVLQDPSVLVKVVEAGSVNVGGSAGYVDIIGYQAAITDNLAYDDAGHTDVGILFSMPANATFQEGHYIMVTSDRALAFLQANMS